MNRMAGDSSRHIVWAHGRAELQRLGAMLGPVVFSAPGHADFSPLQVAPWANEPQAQALPGILRRLRGEWPCVPFGRTDRPADLSAAWPAQDPGDAFGHGYGSNHDWAWSASADPLALALAIDYTHGNDVKRLTRTVRALPDAPALEMVLAIEVRRACRLPLALHPTLRLDAGPVVLQLAHAGPGLTYPAVAEPGVSRLAVDRRFDRLEAVPLAAGGTVDLSRYPLAIDTEELLQLQHMAGPVTAHYLDARWSLQLDWDRTLLPDLMLWVSHRGRRQPPWNGRHWALGLEPVNGPFDLGRVATAPAGHALAGCRGVTLQPGAALHLRYRLHAVPASARESPL